MSRSLSASEAIALASKLANFNLKPDLQETKQAIESSHPRTAPPLSNKTLYINPSTEKREILKSKIVSRVQEGGGEAVFELGKEGLISIQ